LVIDINNVIILFMTESWTLFGTAVFEMPNPRMQ